MGEGDPFRGRFVEKGDEVLNNETFLTHSNGMISSGNANFRM